MLKKIVRWLVKSSLLILGMYIVADLVANEAIKNHYKLEHDFDKDDLDDVMEENSIGGGFV